MSTLLWTPASCTEHGAKCQRMFVGHASTRHHTEPSVSEIHVSIFSRKQHPPALSDLGFSCSLPSTGLHDTLSLPQTSALPGSQPHGLLPGGFPAAPSQPLGLRPVSLSPWFHMELQTLQLFRTAPWPGNYGPVGNPHFGTGGLPHANMPGPAPSHLHQACLFLSVTYSGQVPPPSPSSLVDANCSLFTSLD